MEYSLEILAINVLDTGYMKKKTMHNAMDFTMFAACCLAMLYV
jgi:hypothetical protein